MSKISAESNGVTPTLQVCQIEVGLVQIGDFDQHVTIYISETVRHKELLWITNRNSYALCQMALFPVTPNCPQTTPLLLFCIAFHIFVVGRDRDFKFGR